MTNVIDPREEVKKLQNLVRQLELQNAQLRSKQRNIKIKESSPLRNSTISAVNRRRSLTDKNDNVAKSSLDDVDIIDVNNVLDLSNEDSWLFTSPKTLSEEEKSLSPYKWMRRDVEDPNNVELQTVKRALVNKLDEIARAHFTGIEHLRSPVRTFDDREGPFPHLKHSFGCNRIDSRTFTRSKKRRDDNELKLCNALKVHSLDDNIQCSGATDIGTPDDDCISTASDSSFSFSNAHRLADVVDVQTLARMQEESLQENSPLSSPRRSSVPAHTSAPLSPSVNLENVNSKNNELKSGKQNLKQIKSESLDNALNSTSPGNIVNHLYSDDPSHPSSFRRSLPNLTKQHNGLSIKNLSNCNSTPLIQNVSDSQLGNQSISSESCEDHQNKVFAKDSRPVARESRIPVHSQMKRDSQSSTGSYSRSNSPGARSGIPQLRRSNSPADASPRSGVPKPTQRKLPIPRARSNLPTTSRTSPSSLSHSSDESWKEGCF